LASAHDPDPTPEDDLWFLPAPPEHGAAADLPWAVAGREQAFEPEIWRAAEQHRYRDLVAAAQAVARFGEKLASFPEGMAERFALTSVSAVLRAEGVWLGPEQIALYRVLRSGSHDAARDLARAAWAVRRLISGGGAHGAGGPLTGLHAFLGRTPVSQPCRPLGQEQAVGAELEAVNGQWLAALSGMKACHPLTRAGFAFAFWRVGAITAFDDLLEPAIAAMLIGAGTPARFLPMAPGPRLDGHALTSGAGGARARLARFYGAAEAGALKGCMELDNLRIWQQRARGRCRDLSGRTPRALIETLLRIPVLSAGLAADLIGCSRPAARRNLGLFAQRGLLREVTGQARYRFWMVQV
jgi:hypothetical protein